jgi:hypothetical protein
VWGKPGLKWDGFKPTGYWLDAEKVRSLSLKELPSARNTTIGEVVEKFRGEEVEVDCAIVSVKLKSASQELTVEGPGFHLNLLKLLYRFAEGKVSPYEAVWFYFDGDSCRTDPQSAYSFFIVAQDKIVEENLTLSDSIGNGFDPSVLVHDDSAPIWFAERAWDEATDRYWYRKFYSQTRSGQLMLLRPDNPPIYHSPGNKLPRGATQVFLRSIRLGVWILVVLLLLYVLQHWR